MRTDLQDKVNRHLTVHHRAMDMALWLGLALISAVGAFLASDDTVTPLLGVLSFILAYMTTYAPMVGETLLLKRWKYAPTPGLDWGQYSGTSKCSVMDEMTALRFARRAFRKRAHACPGDHVQYAAAMVPGTSGTGVSTLLLLEQRPSESYPRVLDLQPIHVGSEFETIADHQVFEQLEALRAEAERREHEAANVIRPRQIDEVKSKQLQIERADKIQQTLAKLCQ